MKSKHLLLLLLMAVFAPWAAQAQQALPYSYGFEDNDLSVDGWTTQNPSGLNASEFGINGSAAKTGTYGFRFSSYDDRGASTQYLISPELNAPNGMIVQFYYKSSSSSTSGETFQVGYSTTTTDISSFTFGSANNATNTSWEQTEEFIFPAGTKYVAVYYSPNWQYRLYVDDFTFTAPPACPKPTNLTVGTIGSRSVELSWTENGEASQWEIYCDCDDEERWINASSNPYTLTGLFPSTHYTVKVRANCDGDNGDSQWSNIVTFTTDVACPAPTNLAVAETSITANGATATWNGSSASYVVMIGEPEIGMGTVDFEGQTIPAFFTNDATHPWTVTAGGANDSGYCIIPGNKGVDGSQSDLTCVVTGPCTVSFMAKVSSENNWDWGRFLIDDAQQFQISGTQDWTAYSYDLTEGTHTLVWRYYKDGSGASGNDLFYVDNITMPMPVVNSWTEYTTTAQTYTFDNLDPGTPYQVKVKGNCGSDGYSYETDPVSFTTFALCQEPSALNATEDQPYQSVLSWTAHNGETAWTLYYKKTTDENYTEVANVTENPYTLENLSPATHYQFYVVANCSDTESSNPSAVFSFTTACAAVTTFPWSDDFESYQASSQGITFNNPCWVNEHISGNGSYFFEVYSGTLGGNSTKMLRLRDMSNGTLTKLMLPEMTLPGDNYMFSIDVYRNASGSSYTSEGVRVFVSADGEIEGATELAFLYRNFTQTDGNLIPAESASGWYTYELPIPMSGTCYIILRGESQYGSSTYMDNFAVMPVPTCLKPTNLTQTHTNHSATLNWTAGNEGQNAWQIAYSTTSFNPNSDGFDLTTVEVIDNVDETSYTFDKTLNANTHYYMYVRGYCGDEDYSKWVGIDFTTYIANPSPTITSVDEITPVSAVLRWTAAGGDYLESYDIYYSQTSGQPANDSLIQYTVDAGFTSKILEDLTEGYWYVYMRAYHGETDGYSSWTPYYGYGFRVPEACPEPTGLAASDPTPNSITLTWTEGAEWQYAWKVAYSTDPDFNPEDMDPDTFVDVFGQQGPTITCTVNGLESNTTYYFRVLGNCNSPYGDSDWTNAVSATTLVNCPVPTDLNVTVAQNSATLSWTGYSDSYTVQYRTAGGYDFEIFQGFEEGLGEWTKNHCSSYTGVTTSYGDAMFRFNYTSDYPQYLISPLLNGDNGGTMSFQYARYSNNYTEYFKVGYSTTTNDPEAFTWGDEVTVTNTTEFLEYTYTIPAGTKYVSIACTSDDAFYLFIDDITIQCGEYNEPGDWITYNDNVTSTTATIERLEFGTKYDAQVKANCGEEYCDYITFTINALKRFTTEGAWEVADNWTPAGAPTIDDVVSIEAPATITGVAYADKITIINDTITNGSITIEDGGQLVHNNIGVTATVKKNIVGYTQANYETNNGYYFISNPLTTTTNPVNAGLIEGTYDLYDWNANDYNGKEWHNFDAGGFNLSIINHPGYLYANMNDVTLTFNGFVCNSTNKISVSTYYNSGAEFGKWNLIGNPFVCNAYLVDNDGYALPYYKMNADGNGYTAVTNGAIAPVTGIFYETEANARVYFTREAPVTESSSEVIIVIEEGHSPVDNAIIRFGQGQQMSKFSFRENSSKVYIPMDGQNFAIVNAEGTVGEMPVSFEAEKNGTYSLNFTSQEVSFSYLHLIDNMTGADVDLLQTPSYTFNATTSDYASRFRLVFAAGSSADGDSFSFINASGNLCIFGIEGKATVQVIDVMGHVLSSETFSGSYEKRINAAPGVYMIRLIQGNDVKVQKVVVK